MPYRFVHAADVHLDSPLKSLALRDPALADLIGNATRQAFVRIVDLCLDEGVDALLLGGDLYDGDQTSMKTARFLADQLCRLDRAGIRAFVIRGNHDAMSRITRELILPEGVKVFGGRAEAVRIEAPGFDVVVHGLSFRDPHAAESLLPKFRPPVADAVNIGLMHTSLGGESGEHSRYAPCSVAELERAGFHYWALGHIHKGRIEQARPGAPAVVMPGIPQGRDIDEAGLKGVSLVTIGDDRGVRIERRPTSVAQFERVTVDLDGVADWTGVARAVDKALGLARDAAPSEHLVARLAVTGTTPLAWRLRREMDLLKAEADSRAAALGSVWIEKIEGTGLAAARAPSLPGDPLAELRRLIDEDVLRSNGFRAEFEGIAEELRGALPPECRALLGTDEAGFAAALDALAAEGAEDVLARLGAGGAER